jgi:hypothetical protein
MTEGLRLLLGVVLLLDAALLSYALARGRGDVPAPEVTMLLARAPRGDVFGLVLAEWMPPGKGTASDKRCNGLAILRSPPLLLKLDGMGC